MKDLFMVSNENESMKFTAQILGDYDGVQM